MTVPFTSSSSVPNGSNYEVYYAMDASPYTYNGTKFLNIGPIEETFETGDFSAFDWETLGWSILQMMAIISRRITALKQSTESP